MNIYNIIGALILIVMFVTAFYVMAVDIGAKEALFIFLTSIGIVSLIAISVRLLNHA